MSFLASSSEKEFHEQPLDMATPSQGKDLPSQNPDQVSNASIVSQALNATTTSNTASLQHQQEQEMLLGFLVPNPPISTQQSSAAAENEHGFQGGVGRVGAPRTLWMGDLDPWLDEAAISDLWWQIMNKRVTVKIIKPRGILPEQITAPGLAHSGYCFVEFETFDDAQQSLGLNGQLLPDIAMPSQQHFPNNPDNQKKYFRLNWASGATLSAPIVQTPEFSLFVGDLSASTTEAHLLAFFQKSFPSSIKTVRVMTDPVSGKSRCFGFVRFTDESERQRALIDLQGAWFGGRPLRLALATPRNTPGRHNFHHQQHRNSGHPNFYYGGYDQQEMLMNHPGNGPGVPPYNNYYTQPQFIQQQPPLPPHHQDQNQQQQQQLLHQSQNESNDPSESSSIKSPTMSATQQPQQHLDGSIAPPAPVSGQPFTDPNNTTVFVGGLSSEVTEQTLFMLFKPFGIIQQVKIPPGKNCGFIKYSTREEAEEAIAAMQGFVIGGNRVRLSWGRVSANNKKYQQQQQQVAQAAQIEAAAALSMGLDPASAIAAAAAVAAGGFPPAHIPRNGPPNGGGFPPHMMAHMGMPQMPLPGTAGPGYHHMGIHPPPPPPPPLQLLQRGPQRHNGSGDQHTTPEGQYVNQNTGMNNDHPREYGEHHQQDDLVHSMNAMNLGQKSLDGGDHADGDHKPYGPGVNRGGPGGYMISPPFGGAYQYHEPQYHSYIPQQYQPPMESGNIPANHRHSKESDGSSDEPLSKSED